MVREQGRHAPAMEIGISGISDGEHPFAFEIAPEQIDLDASFGAPIIVKGTMHKVSTQYVVEAVVMASTVRECDRCLAEFIRPAEIPMKVYYRLGVSDRHAHEDREDTEVNTLLPDAESIVLDDDVRQAILLELPLKFLCNEECRGMCPTCGADLNREPCRCETTNVDPRWAQLADLLKRNGEQ